MSAALNWAYRWLLWMPLTDISGGFRLYRADDVRKMSSNAMHYDVPAELVVRLWGNGYKILELPYHYSDREFGNSKARVLKYAMSYFATLLRLRLWLSAKRD